jgi:hypothetical protein
MHVACHHAVAYLRRGASWKQDKLHTEQSASIQNSCNANNLANNLTDLKADACALQHSSAAMAVAALFPPHLQGAKGTLVRLLDALASVLVLLLATDTGNAAHQVQCNARQDVCQPLLPLEQLGDIKLLHTCVLSLGSHQDACAPKWETRGTAAPGMYLLTTGAKVFRYGMWLQVLRHARCYHAEVPPLHATHNCLDADA